MRTVAYLRVSTAQQDVRSQRLAILEYARQHDLRIDDFIEATASGQASEKRRRLDELLNGLQRGDRLVVSELSRLGRSLGQIVAILDALAKAGVAFVALKENIRVEGKRDIQTKVMTTLFALFAEVERDLISERTREGLAKARASGRKLGRPKGSLGVSRLDGKEDEIRHFLELGVSKTAIAKITGVSRSALYSFMTTRGLRPTPLACIRTRMLSVPLSRPLRHTWSNLPPVLPRVLRAGQQVLECVVDARRAEVRFPLERPPDVAHARGVVVAAAEQDEGEDEVVRFVQRVQGLVLRDGDRVGVAPASLDLDEPQLAGGRVPALDVVAELVELAVGRLEASIRTAAGSPPG